MWILWAKYKATEARIEVVTVNEKIGANSFSVPLVIHILLPCSLYRYALFNGDAALNIRRIVAWFTWMFVQNMFNVRWCAFLHARTSLCYRQMGEGGSDAFYKATARPMNQIPTMTANWIKYYVSDDGYQEIWNALGKTMRHTHTVLQKSRRKSFIVMWCDWNYTKTHSYGVYDSHVASALWHLNDSSRQ